MTTPASDQNESSKMKKLTSGSMDEFCPRQAPTSKRRRSFANASLHAAGPSHDFLHICAGTETLAFQIPASLLDNREYSLLNSESYPDHCPVARFPNAGYDSGTSILWNGQASGLLGGLYSNFVKMDQAKIATTIPVDAMIPLNIEVPVQKTTQITLAETAVIPNAHVRINTGEVNINANAVVTLPAGTLLTVSLNFPLTVQNSIPVHLDVPVDIPLSQTELHEPFVGLQEVVRPWYCLIEPNAMFNGSRVCSQVTDPVLPTPTPVGTVIP